MIRVSHIAYESSTTRPENQRHLNKYCKHGGDIYLLDCDGSGQCKSYLRESIHRVYNLKADCYHPAARLSDLLGLRDFGRIRRHTLRKKSYLRSNTSIHLGTPTDIISLLGPLWPETGCVSPFRAQFAQPDADLLCGTRSRCPARCASRARPVVISSFSKDTNRFAAVAYTAQSRHCSTRKSSRVPFPLICLRLVVALHSIHPSRHDRGHYYRRKDDALIGRQFGEIASSDVPVDCSMLIPKSTD
jgi:hypothetical protein